MTNQPELIANDPRLGVIEVKTLHGVEGRLRRDGWSWITATPIPGGWRLDCERVTPQGTHRKRSTAASINTAELALDAVAVAKNAKLRTVRNLLLTDQSSRLPTSRSFRMNENISEYHGGRHDI